MQGTYEDVSGPSEKQYFNKKYWLIAISHYQHWVL